MLLERLPIRDNRLLPLLIRESPSRHRHLLAVLPRSSLKRPRPPGRLPSPRLHPRWQSASAGTMASHAQRTASLPLPSICFPASPAPRQRRPRLPTPSVQQECCSPSRRFRLPTQRSPVQPQSVQSWSSRSAPFPPESEPRFARNEKDAAPVPFQHRREIVSREPHSAHHVYLEEAVPVRIGNLRKPRGIENGNI